MYDSLGESHAATMSYVKTATNTWNYTISLPPGDETGTPINNTGTLVFNSFGGLISPLGSIDNVIFPGLTDGAADLDQNWAIGPDTGTPLLITQFASASTNTGIRENGNSVGLFQSFSIDSNGVITAQLSNGESTPVGQIAVATVGNTAGLTASGNNNFSTTAASGQASIGVAGTGGRGTIDDGALEQSNVDISTEFSNLIVAQRAFEANSKTMTTFDKIAQDSLGLVR